MNRFTCSFFVLWVLELVWLNNLSLHHHCLHNSVFIIIIIMFWIFLGILHFWCGNIFSVLLLPTHCLVFFPSCMSPPSVSRSGKKHLWKGDILKWKVSLKPSCHNGTDVSAQIILLMGHSSQPSFPDHINPSWEKNVFRIHHMFNPYLHGRFQCKV